MSKPLVVYFHRVPGSSDELAAVGAASFLQRPDVLAIDRCDIAPGIPFAASIDELVRRITSHAGDFLASMAGKPLFALARRSPPMLRRAASLQSTLALMAPDLLFKALFAGAQGADRQLARDAAFKRAMQACMKRGLGHRGAAYARDLVAYVQPWAGTLASVGARAHLWHGDQDNWAPKGMAPALGRALPNVGGIRLLEGLSHYSTLRFVLSAFGDSQTAPAAAPL